jgi:hypothetical protein
LISNFCCVLNFVFFLGGDHLVSEICVSTFRNSVPSCTTYEDGTECTKCGNINFRHRRITKKRKQQDENYLYDACLKDILERILW